MITDNVLVLNRHYSPVNVCSVKRALSMLFQQKAEVVTYENNTFCNYDIHSWSELTQLKIEMNILEADEEIMNWTASIIIPRVIRVLEYNRIPTRKVKLNRRNIYLRDNNICQYCGRKLPVEELNLDHVLPRAQGGISSWTNLVASCYKCNSKKGSKTPEQARIKLIRRPFEPKNSAAFNASSINGSIKYKSWKNFIDQIYWNVEILP